MNHPHNIDALFSKAAEQPVVASFGETKELFLETTPIGSYTSRSQSTQVFTLKNGLIMIAIISTIITAILLMTTPTKNKAKETKSDARIVEQTNYTQETSTETFTTETVIETKKNRRSQIQLPVVSQTPHIDSNRTEANANGKHLEKNRDKTSRPNLTRKLPYRFPVLTEEEIEANHKRKKKMIKDLSKLHKSKLMKYIPSGTFEYKNTPTSVQAFYMHGSEVTNQEYKTFLFDLLIQDRKEEFLKAKPDQTQWIKDSRLDAQSLETRKIMQDGYFSDKSFGDFSVNNVSREGAQMFCAWLTTEINNYNSEKGIPLINDLRLPEKEEWIYAASEGGKHKTYSWGTDSLTTTHKKKKYFVANFSVNSYDGDLNSISLQENRGDTSGVSTYYYMYYLYTAATWMEQKRGFGLMQMCGNMAEMVYENGVPGTVGGGWLSPASELKMSAEDPNSGKTDPDLNIGFRFVVTDQRNGN